MIDAHPQVAERLRGALARYARTARPTPEDGDALDLEAIDPETRRMLRALGYLGGPGG